MFEEDIHVGLAHRRDTVEVFRGAKLRISDIDPALIEQILRENRRLVARLVMTDREGLPIRARVRPPWVEWSLA